MWSDLAAPKVPLTRTGKVAWLMSFIDLLSIILCAFVLLFAMKAMDLKRWSAVSGSFRQTFATPDGGMAGPVEIRPDGRLNARDAIHPPLADGLRYMDSVLRRRLSGDARWDELSGRFVRTGEQRARMLYALPAQGVTEQDWQRLAAALRHWDNRMQLVVQASPLQAEAALTGAAVTFAALRAAGVSRLDAIEWRPGMDSGVNWRLELQVRGR